MSLRQELRGRRVRALAFVNVPEAALVEVAAHNGFDAVVIDAEHGPLSIRDIAGLVRAADAVRIPSMVRVPSLGREFVLRSLDAGARGILAPQIDTPDLAALAVSECRYPPVGTRGAGFYARQHRFSVDRGRGALDTSDDSVAVGVQIESVAAVEAAEKILATDGIDYVFVGPTDLSVSHGSCDAGHPWVVDAIARIGALCRERGIASGIYAATPEAAEAYAQAGYDSVAVGMLPLLNQRARAFTDGVRTVFGGVGA